MLVSAFATFLPKVIEQQFSLTTSKAAILMGVVTIPGAEAELFLVVKHWWFFGET